MDSLPPHERSQRMALIKGKNTQPELVVRRLVFSMGYRYRLHDKNLPGKPDVVFKGRKKVIFTHGCFWHRHDGCPLARLAKSKLDFWLPKLSGNKDRDLKNIAKLSAMGWKSFVIWECETKDWDQLKTRIEHFLS